MKEKKKVPQVDLAAVEVRVTISNLPAAFQLDKEDKTKLRNVLRNRTVRFLRDTSVTFIS